MKRTKRGIRKKTKRPSTPTPSPVPSEEIVPDSPVSPVNAAQSQTVGTSQPPRYAVSPSPDPTPATTAHATGSGSEAPGSLAIVVWSPEIAAGSTKFPPFGSSEGQQSTAPPSDSPIAEDAASFETGAETLNPDLGIAAVEVEAEDCLTLKEFSRRIKGKKKQSGPEPKVSKSAGKATETEEEEVVKEPPSKKRKRAEAVDSSKKQGKKVVKPRYNPTDDETHESRSKRFKNATARKLVQHYMTRVMIGQRYVNLTSEPTAEVAAVLRHSRMTSTVDLEFLAPYIHEVICEFYAHLPHERTEKKQVKVWVRGYEYKFSAKAINELLDFPVPTAAEAQQANQCNKVSDNKVARFLCGEKVSWKEFATTRCTPLFASLWILSGYNWLPTDNRTHKSIEKARFLYKMAHGHRFDFGEWVFQKVLARGRITYNKAGLYFPSLISALLMAQHPFPAYTGETYVSPLEYVPDSRSGKAYSQAHQVEISSDDEAAKTDSTSASDTEATTGQQYETVKVKIPTGKVSTVAAVEALRDTITKLQDVLHALETGGEGSTSGSGEF